MEENKNQTVQNTADGLVVKDTDGSFKVLSDGELKDADALLAATAQTISPQAVVPPRSAQALDAPRFTDLATIPEDEHFQALEKTTASGTIAEHHFHPDDKEELERELDKLNTIFNVSPRKQYSIIKITQRLAEKHGLKLSESEFNACVKLCASYFRQMRSLVETRVQLTRSKNEGGLGIALDTADHMLAVLKHLKDKIEEMDGTVVEEDIERQVHSTEPMQPHVQPQKPVQAQPAPSSIPTISLKNPKVSTEKPVAPGIEPSAPQRVETPQASPPPSIVDRAPEKKALPLVTPEPKAKEADAIPKVTRPSSIPTFRAPIIEVKRPQVNAVISGRPTGRVEELALMDMSTWRMLDPDPRICAGKILGKIQNLEQESLTRKSQGIQAWRSNEVYQHYLAIGQMSLEQKKDVAEVIKSIKAQGQDTLTLEEFEAISDLNRMLRF